MKVLYANINIIKEINRLDKTRNLFTAIFNVSDTVDIIIYNALFLPFIYYAVEHKFPTYRYLTVAGILFLMVLCNAAYSKFYHGYLEQLSNMKIKHVYNKQLFIKAGKYDYADITRAEYYEKYSMLLNIGAGKLVEGLDMIWWAVSVLLLSLFYIAVIQSISFTLVFAALLCALAVYFINLKYIQYEYQYHTETVRTSRKSEYFGRVFLMEKYAADLRTTNIFHALEKDKNRMFCQLKKVIASGASKRVLLFSIIKKLLLFLVTTAFVAIYMAWNYLVKGNILLSVSEIVVAQALMLQMSTILSDLAMIYPKLKQNMLYMKDYQEFMDYEPAIQENAGGLVPKGGAGALALRNVSFGYEEGRMVLKNISMEIGAGEKIAIVGYNGAGKSTLVKILLRLCRPEEGEVLMDGKPAETYSLKAYRGRFATAFQESNLYALTAAENVLMDVYTEDKREAVEEALGKAGIRERLPAGEAGLGSEMTKEFSEEGIELSGGQVQKLALSRVYAEEKGIIILDEPSSALDPVSESRMYQEMLKSAEGKTLILISHRLSLVREADRIYYLEDGRIEEAGSHEELLGKNGKYAALWHVQADKYAAAGKGEANEKGTAD